MTNESAIELFDNIKQLITDNRHSVLNFDSELTQAELYTARQQEEIVQMAAVHSKIKFVANSQTRVSPEELRELKSQFNTHYEQYQENESLLKNLYTKLDTAYAIENKIMKDQLLKESTEMLENLVGQISVQDEKIQHLEEKAMQEFANLDETIQESLLEETAEVELENIAEADVVTEVSLSEEVTETDKNNSTEEVVSESKEQNIHDTLLQAQEMLLSESTSSQE